MFVRGKKIYLKLLTIEDVSDDYVNWMNDNKVTEFLESRWKAYTLEDLKEYVKTMNESQNNFLFGIFDQENDKHIGNIKIGNINYFHRYGDIGLLVGNKDYWGKGVATEAIGLVTKYGFEELNLNKVFAGMYSLNKGSYEAFIKNGFSWDL